MADYKKQVAENVEGLFFVDATCIDCDTCRQLAPRTFFDVGSYSAVHHQPSDANELLSASQALLSCPTGSIGTTEKIDLHQAIESLPLQLEENVFYNGYASKHSFGASSYFIRHPDGNWLIDSPKYQQQLVKRFEGMGGISHIFLSHSDDVADADRYAAHFSATRIIHSAERNAQPEAEIFLEGEEPVRFGDDILIIPTPGHTRGHCVLLYKDILFSGDHLWWSRGRNSLSAGRDVCWYSWSEQTRSMEKLLGYDFRSVYPGHGERVSMSPQEIRQELIGLVGRMKEK